MLWVVLANVSGGNWTEQTPEWQEAAARWRDYYFSAVFGRPSCANGHPTRVPWCLLCVQAERIDRSMAARSSADG